MRSIGAGETLRIVWPGAKQTASGPDQGSCEPLAMLAMLFPEKLADAAMAEVERMAFHRPKARRASARSRI